MSSSSTLTCVASAPAVSTQEIIDTIYELVDTPSRLQHLLMGLIRCIELSESEFSFVDEEILNLRTVSDELLPHFKKAIEIQIRFYEHHQVINLYGSIINQIEVPIFVLDDSGRVVKANNACWQNKKRNSWINSKPGLPLLKDETGQKLLLSSLIALGESDVYEPIQLGKKNSGMWFAIRLDGKGKDCYLLTGSDQTTIERLVANVCQRYRLSKKEAQVLSVLLEGRNTKEIAEKMYISVYTVKNHIRSIFNKTGTSKQLELIRRVYLSFFPAATPEFYQKIILGKDDHDFTLSDGRNLSYQDIGSKDLPVAIYFHSFGGSRMEIPLQFHPSTKNLFRWISVDRPGFGRSSPHSAGGFQGFAHDVGELVRHLEIKRVNVIGYSLGAVYAMAFERFFSHKIIQMYLVSPAPNVDIVLNSRSRSLMKSYYKIVNYLPKITGYIVSLFGQMSPQDCMDSLLFGKVQVFEVSEIDKHFFKDPIWYEFFLSCMREMVQQGSRGWGVDAVNLAGPWGFDIQAPLVPTKMIQGSLDSMVSLDMTLELARQMKISDLEIYDNETHMLIFRYFESIAYQMREDFDRLMISPSETFQLTVEHS